MALACDPTFEAAHEALGVAYAKAGRLVDARRAFEEGIRVVGRSPSIHLLLARMLLSMSDDEAAERHFRMALEEHPELWPARRHLGRMLMDQRGRLGVLGDRLCMG